MQKGKTTSATFNKSARVISDYTNDMIFEQPRENLIQQEFVSYEVVDAGGVNCIKKTTITRKFDKAGGYGDSSQVQILG